MSKQWMLYKFSDLQNMDFEELKEHDSNIWEYWRTVRKVVEYRELAEEKLAEFKRRVAIGEEVDG